MTEHHTGDPFVTWPQMIAHVDRVMAGIEDAMRDATTAMADHNQWHRDQLVALVREAKSAPGRRSTQVAAWAAALAALGSLVAVLVFRV